MVSQMLQRFGAYFFYFDIIGVVEAYLNDRSVIQRLTDFQRQVRMHPHGTGEDGTNITTVFDNVWVRLSDGETVADHKILEIAGFTMKAAREHGFERFFGAITYGEHEFDLQDRVLVSGGDLTSLQKQHLDLISEPQIRAASIEKWSKALHHAHLDPVRVPSVWVSEEVMDPETIADHTFDVNEHFVVRPERFDLSKLPVGGRAWPFTESRFSAIVGK